MPDGYFTIETIDITNLSAQELADFCRRLLWAEGSQVGIAQQLMLVPSCINVADGGIDAVIYDATPTVDDVIPRGTTGFQFKASASGLNINQCRQELHIEENRRRPLKPMVERIAQIGSTYILVMSVSLTNAQVEKRKNAIKEEFTNLGYPDLQVRVYTADQLVGFGERHLGIVAWLKKRFSQGLPYTTWGSHIDVNTPLAYFPDQQRQEWIDAIRDSLRNRGGQCPVYRVTGPGGIGKTRLVYEALAPDDLKCQVVYMDDETTMSSQVRYELENNNTLHAILVFDECNIDDHRTFVNSFARRGNRLAVITISQDHRGVPTSTTSVIQVHRLDAPTLEDLVKSHIPHAPSQLISRIVVFSDGFPGLATLLSQSYQSAGDTWDGLTRFDDQALIDRLIGGHHTSSTELFRKNKLVLEGLSLFTRIGHGQAVKAEAEWLAEYLGMSIREFNEIVQYQKDRGIVLGENYIYVTPILLRIHLMREWWITSRLDAAGFGEFIASMPDDNRADLLGRFHQQFPYIQDVDAGAGFIEELLSQEGPFLQDDLLETEAGADFFLQLAVAQPRAALHVLRIKVGTWDKQKRMEFHTGRRQVIAALEEIAVRRDLFSGAAQLLASLAVAENERWSNNATGVFTGLFSPAPGKLAPTEATPQERLPILQALLHSLAHEDRILAIKACDVALKTQGYMRLLTESTRTELNTVRWTPQSHQEVIAAVKEVWSLLSISMQMLAQAELNEAKAVLLKRARELIRYQDLAAPVVETLNYLRESGYASTTELTRTVLEMLHARYMNLPNETKARLEELRYLLLGDGFSAELKRYVAHNIIEDDFDEEGNLAHSVAARIEGLAARVIENPLLIVDELTWLVTDEAQRGTQFGYSLGQRDLGASLFGQIINAQMNGPVESKSTLFLGGYLRTVFERDPEQWEAFMDTLAKIEPVNRSLIELTWRSGISQHAMDRLFMLVDQGIVHLADFGIFEYGSVLPKLAEQTFADLIHRIHNSQLPGKGSLALALFHRYYEPKQGHPEFSQPLGLTVLLHPSLLTEYERGSNLNNMDEYYWSEVASRLIELYPESSRELANSVIPLIGEDTSIFSSPHMYAEATLNKIVQKYPEDTWGIITEHLEVERGWTSYRLQDWLKGGEFHAESLGTLSLLPYELVAQWINEDRGTRAPLLAGFSPVWLPNETGITVFAHQLLADYGDIARVRRRLWSSSMEGVHTGPASIYLQNRLQMLSHLRQIETNLNVIAWLNEYIIWLEKRIQEEKLLEEREGY